MTVRIVWSMRSRNGEAPEYYNDYHDLVPSSVEEENSITPGTDLFCPLSNKPLKINASEFPEEDAIGTTPLANAVSSHHNDEVVDSAVSIEFDNLVLEDISDPLRGALYSTSSAFQPFGSDGGLTDFAEFDFSSLAKLTEGPKLATASTGSTKHLNSASSVSLNEEKSKVDAVASDSIQSCQKISPLGHAFAQSRSSIPRRDLQFLNLIVEIRRPRTFLFLHNPPSSKPPDAFKFDTPQPVQFDSPSDLKMSSNVLPKTRTKPSKLQRNLYPSKDPSGKPSVEPPSSLPLVETSTAATRLPKVASEAKVSTQPAKPIDRSSLFHAYQKKISSGKEKDIINLLVVGHVDAGKSTLMGNVLCQLGHVSEKQLAKYQWEAQKIGKASFAYAWVLDQTSEERSRGITMDIAQIAFETHSKRVVLLDAPGHRDFVPQVIGGAAQADVALLVVNATSGEFETGMQLSGGQTQEHARLVRLLGVSRLIVAVNKMDTVSWSQSRFEEIRTVMMRMLKTINQPDVVFCPVSGLYGINLLHSSDTPPERDIQHLAPWYSGPCLLDIIDSLDKVERPVDAPFRFVVSDIFKPIGSSVPIVAGRVVSGAVSAGVNLPTSKIICLPSGQTGTVRSIRSLAAVPSDGGGSGTGVLDIILPYAFAGDQVGLMLSGLDADLALTPGDVICDPDPPLASVTTRLRAKVLIFDVQQPITRGYPVIFYYHCSSVPAVITKLLSATVKDEERGKKDVVKPRCLLGRCTAEIELALESPVCVEIYDVCKPLGRFVLRVGGESIAGGTIVALKRGKIGSVPVQSEVK
ncbi:eukaryotic release factor 3 erfs [Echinococcus multilocularis]|uniref:Eukaryotic release factor 3 erfs n=1 Tax=Echinococcus multilocularis TaxID=6211 RepID=A0A068Y9V6_ECHMU|nr:eukaryotic release factor 3 erfs [Echinococcus multilocularis]